MLLDFGIACRVNISCDKPVGTIIYVAPEVIINRVIEPASDIWSLGITIMKALGFDPWGNIPSHQKKDQRKFFKYLASNAPPPQLNTTNKLLNLVVNSMLIKNVKERKTAHELLQMLDNIHNENLNKKEPTLNDVILSQTTMKFPIQSIQSPQLQPIQSPQLRSIPSPQFQSIQSPRLQSIQSPQSSQLQTIRSSNSYINYIRPSSYY